MEYVRLIYAHNTAAKVQLHIRETLYDKIVELGPARLGSKRTGDVIVTLIESVERLEIYFGKYLPQLFVAAVTPILIFAFVWWIDWAMASVFLVAALVTLMAPAAFHRWDSRNSLTRSRAYGDFAAEFLDSIQGLATLKSFGQSGTRARFLAEKSDAVFRSTMWILATSSLSRGITDTGIAFGAVATISLGAYRVEQGAMSLESLLVVLLLGTEVLRPLRDLRSMLHSGMLALSAGGKIIELMEEQPVIRESKDSVDPTLLLPATLAFENVDFSYPGGRGRTHRGLSFIVTEGERIGIVGESGVGKTSIVRLLLRIYDPEEGRVLIGGRDLKELSYDQIRQQLAIVNQDTYLFHGTVEENLRLGNPSASQEELEAAARAANAHEFVAALPQGYRTVVGERGIKLSGGQRQRIAIARALLRDAPILILDEALSAVDAENEAVIQEALDRLMEGRTTLILAHRLSSVIGADRILVLDQGRVVEQGTHESLMARGAAYWNLMSGQARDLATGLDFEIADGPRLALETGPAFGDSPEVAVPEEWSIIHARGIGWAQAITNLMEFARPWRVRLMLIFIFGISRVSAFIAVGLVSALTVAAVKLGQPIVMLVAVLFVLAPSAGALHWFESWIAHDMAYRLLTKMRIELFKKVDKLAPAYLVRRRTGDLVAMATDDVEMVEFFFAHTIAPSFVAVLVPSVAITVLAAFHWVLALVLLPFLVVVAVSPFVLRLRIDRLASADREVLGELNAHTVDTLQGLTEIIAFQQQQPRKAQFVDLIKKHHAVRLPFFSNLTLQTVSVELMTMLGGLTVVMTGGYLVQHGHMAATYLPLLTLLGMAAFLPISEIADIGRQLADTLGATRRLHVVHSEPIAVTDGPLGGEPDRRGGCGVRFDGVTFRYPGFDRATLDNVSFELKPGTTVALVGPSGAGKSTLAHLLLRFWDPDTGAVSLGDNDLRSYRLDVLRRQVALVAQDTYLFNDTLKANILIARPDATETEIDAAVRRAALHTFIVSLPQGLETRVGERGMALSGGQRQRVAIARAFLRDAPVLVLDEATSHLDATSERMVHEALSDLMKDRTTLVIAHRLSTVREAGKIVVMDQGRLVEQGKHADLLAKGGLYARLVGRQLAGAASRPAERAV